MTGFPDGTYRRAFTAMGTPALLADTDFVVRDVNLAGQHFTGYDETDLVGEPVTTVTADVDTYTDIVETLLEGATWQGDFELLTADGDIVFGRGSASPIVADGEVQGYVAIFIDTTTQRRYEQTTNVLNRVLRHDLRNDLNIVYGHVQNLENALPADRDRTHIDQVKTTLTALIEKSARARTLQRWLERTHGTENHPIALDGAIHEALVDAIETYPEASFQFDELPSVPVQADELLSSVFEVLLENAVLHNDAETPRVAVSVEEGTDSIRVQITDNGPGVRSGQEDLIFGREERNQLHHGQGLSLFFADTVIRGYGGNIWVESPEARGATFIVELHTA